MKKAQRLSREQWLSLALDYLSRGHDKLTIDKLVTAVGVSKGSFYWHFKNRNDFLEQLLAYWDDHFTQSVVNELRGRPQAPVDQLWSVMEIVCQKNLTRYDIAIRAWVAREPEFIDRVRQVDRARIKTIRGLFRQLGFEGDELEMRTRSFVTYVSFELGITVRQSKKKRLECMRRYHQLVTSQ